MTLPYLDWTTLTIKEAKKLLPGAKATERSRARAYNDYQIPEFEWKEAAEREEDLVVFIKTGLKPGQYLA